MEISLRDISRAIKGMIVMSSDLDSMHTAFLNNQVYLVFIITFLLADVCVSVRVITGRSQGDAFISIYLLESDSLTLSSHTLSLTLIFPFASLIPASSSSFSSPYFLSYPHLYLLLFLLHLHLNLHLHHHHHLHLHFLHVQVPSIWLKDSFASLKSLGSWVTDLTFRVNFFRSWLTNGSPCAFPLPVFFFPQGFMTASLQTYARDHLEAIDNLSFAYEILSTTPEDIKVAPADGVVVYGLYLEVRTYVYCCEVV